MSNAGLRRPVLDLPERGRRKRFADYNGPESGNQGDNDNPQGTYPKGAPVGSPGNPIIAGVSGGGGGGGGGYSPGSYQQQTGQTWAPSTQGATGAQINDPSVNPNAYQYGGAPGGATGFNQYLQGLAGSQAAQQGAQIQNQYDPRDQAQVQGTLGQLSNFYTGQMNGTGPSLAAQQAQAAMDQSIQAQAAMANSARGGLSGAAAQMQAAQSGAAAQQAAAQQAVQGRIQEEYNAAQGMQGVGQLGEGEQQINAQTAYEQAALQQQQQDINARMGLGYAGLENSVNTEQLNAQMQQQAQMSGNYLGASGMGMQQSQFNTTNANNMLMGGLGAASGLLLAAADADFQEPAPGEIGRKGGRGFADADMHPPAHLTLREENTVDGAPFLAIADQNTGVVRKLATLPLTHAEAARVAAPHGAGPIFAQGAARAHTTFHDMPMAPQAPMTLGPRGRMSAPAPMMGQPARPMMPQAPMGGQPARPTPGPGMPPQGAPPGYAMPARPQMRVPDMDLSGARRRYHDAGLGDPAIQGQLANLDWGASQDPMQGGTLMDQLRAQEAGKIAANAPPGGYTPAQQQFYQGAGGPGTPTAGLTSDQAAAHFGGNGPSLGAMAGNAIGGGYRPAAMAAASTQKDNGPTPTSKLQQAGADLMKSSLQRMGGQSQPAPMPNYGGLAGAASFQPMNVATVNPFADVDLGGAVFPNETDRMYGLYGAARVADMDLGDPGIMPPIQHAPYAMSPVGSRPPPGAVTAGVAGLQDHMRRLQAADADLKSRARLGSGARFSHLEHSLAHRPGVHDPGALAAYIGRQAHGAHEMAHLAAAHRGK